MVLLGVGSWLPGGVPSVAYAAKAAKGQTMRSYELFECLCIYFGIFRYKQYNSGEQLIPVLSDSS